MWRSTTLKTKSVDFTPDIRQSCSFPAPSSKYRARAFRASNVARRKEEVFEDTVAGPHSQYRRVVKYDGHSRRTVVVFQLQSVFHPKYVVTAFLQSIDYLPSGRVSSFQEYRDRLVDDVVAVVDVPAVATVSDRPLAQTHPTEAMSISASYAAVHR